MKIIYILEDEIKTAMNWTVCWPVWAICTDISPMLAFTSGIRYDRILKAAIPDRIKADWEEKST